MCVQPRVEVLVYPRVEPRDEDRPGRRRGAGRRPPSWRRVSKRLRATLGLGFAAVGIGLGVSLAAVTASGGEGAPAPSAPASVGLRLVAGGLSTPVALAPTGDGTGRLLVAEQMGLLRLIVDGRLQSTPFLDIRDRMALLYPQFDERGLLGVAVHPRFEENGRVFVYYSGQPRRGAPVGTGHTNYLSEFGLVEGDRNRGDPRSERVLLTLDYDESKQNHQGGQLAFGPDGYLYVGVGDGGTNTTAQSRGSLFGKLLRLDVNGARPYGVPPSNPFVGKEGRDEIYAYGFRNPFRFSFDRDGERGLFVGDVGGDRREEIDVVVLGGNYGWSIREGRICFAGYGNTAPAQCPRMGAEGEPLRGPILEYTHSLGSSVTGGYVYRGSAIAGLRGRYVYGDWAIVDFESWRMTRGGSLFAAEAEGDQWVSGPLRASLGQRQLLALGEDDDGELYALTVDGLAGPMGNTASDPSAPPGDTGKVWRLVSAS